MKRFLLITTLVVAIALIAMFLSTCSAMGTLPTDEERKAFERSPQYNAAQKAFDNRRPNLYEKMYARISYFDAFYKMFTAEKTTPPSPLPEVKPDLEEFIQPTDSLKVVWFGHSSFLLNVQGTIVLVDPVLSPYASPVFFFSRRFQPTIVEPEDLPHIDYVVISHDHYDHLDMPSIEHFVDTDTKFLAPLGVGAHLRGWGVKAANITELDWWETVDDDDLHFVATPAQHFSGRDGVNPNATLWASWVIHTDEHRIFFSGDSGYDIHYKEIGKRYGPFDIAFLETGQYNKQWIEVHMLPNEGAQAFHDLRAQRYFPVHWGMFPLALHPWDEPIQEIYKHHKSGNVNLIAPIIGESLVIGGEYRVDPWWERVVQ